MLDEKQLGELKAQHGRIARVADKDGGWEVVFRKPTRAEYKRFRSMLHTDGLKAEATEWLARSTVIHPTPEAFDVLLEEYPAIGDASGDEIGKLLGLTVDKVGKG